MLEYKTKKRIKEHTWNKHSNPSQFLKRIEFQSKVAISDLQLLADNLDDERLSSLFFNGQIEKLISSIINSDMNDDKKFIISCRLLKILFEYTPPLIDNVYAKQLFVQHGEPLKNLFLALSEEKDIRIRQTNLSKFIK